MTRRRYARNHVWAELDGDSNIVVGLSARAIEQLGRITDFSLRVQPGAELGPGECFAVVESDKAEVELFTPVSGAVVRVNSELDFQPERISDDCYGEGWMIALRPPDLSEYDALLDALAYSELLKTASATE
ncbi:MAG TPA: glycine cleavage system protein H [Nannocystis sp.]